MATEDCLGYPLMDYYWKAYNRLYSQQMPRPSPAEAKPFWIVWMDTARKPLADGEGKTIQFASYELAVKDAETNARIYQLPSRVLRVDPISKSVPASAVTTRY